MPRTNDQGGGGEVSIRRKIDLIEDRWDRAYEEAFGSGIRRVNFNTYYLYQIPVKMHQKAKDRAAAIDAKYLRLVEPLRDRLYHSDESSSYNAGIRYVLGDLYQHGILGMRWGKRRTEAQLASDTAKRKASGEEVTPTAKAQAVSSGPETAAARYSRLKGEAKGGGHKSWSEEDLAFFNKRTEAEAKVNKMFEQNPGWLSTTSKRVLQNAAQRTMQDVANGVTNKYITSKLLDSLNNDDAAKLAESKTPVDYIGKHRAKQKK